MSDLNSILKPNATIHDRAVERAIRQARPDLTPIASLMDPATCPVNLLPWLAWAFSVEVWDSAWPEGIKRNVIKDAVRVHRLKGTKTAVSEALASLGMDGEISEWFEYGGEPHTFKIDVLVDRLFEAGFRMDQTLVQTVDRLIRNVKPARSQYELRLGRPVNIDVSGAINSSARHVNHAAFRPMPRTHEATDLAAGRSSGNAIAINRRSFSPLASAHAGAATGSMRHQTAATRLSRVAYQLQIGSA